MTVRLRPTLIYKLPDRTVFPSALLHRSGFTSVFVPGTTTLTPGMRVDFGILFEEGPRAFATRGIVRWKRESLGHILPPGLCVELPASEESTRDLILAYVRGKHLRWTERSERRLPVMHAESFAAGDYVTSEVTEDIGKQGAFLTSGKLLAPGTEIDIKIKPPGELFALRFCGQVVWGSKKRGGIGVRFTFPNAHAKARFETFVDRLSEQTTAAIEVHGPQGRL